MDNRTVKQQQGGQQKVAVEERGQVGAKQNPPAGRREAAPDFFGEIHGFVALAEEVDVAHTESIDHQGGQPGQPLPSGTESCRGLMPYDQPHGYQPLADADQPDMDVHTEKAAGIPAAEQEMPQQQQGENH